MSQRILRRREVVLGAASLVGCSIERPQEGFLGATERFNNRVQAALFDPERLAPTVPIEERTPEDEFPAYKIGLDYPEVPAGWALELGGAVAHPRGFSLSDLERMPRTEIRVRHHCVEGWSAVASWHGVRLRDIAAIAGADPNADYVDFVSFESVSMPLAELVERPDAKTKVEGRELMPPGSTYSSSWDRASALHPQTLLAYGMNGHRLSRLHGGPVRLYSPTKLGYKMVKWLRAVRFLSAPAGGYWEDQGYEWFAGV